MLQKLLMLGHRESPSCNTCLILYHTKRLLPPVHPSLPDALSAFCASLRRRMRSSFCFGLVIFIPVSQPGAEGNIPQGAKPSCHPPSQGGRQQLKARASNKPPILSPLGKFQSAFAPPLGIRYVLSRENTTKGGGPCPHLSYSGIDSFSSPGIMALISSIRSRICPDVKTSPTNHPASSLSSWAGLGKSMA